MSALALTFGFVAECSCCARNANGTHSANSPASDQMTRGARERRGIDAAVISPHKFPGGPGASGVLIVRRDAVRTTTPTWPGGGTVAFVSPWGHDYSASIEAREEAGTPNVIGDIRTALALVQPGGPTIAKWVEEGRFSTPEAREFFALTPVLFSSSPALNSTIARSIARRSASVTVLTSKPSRVNAAEIDRASLTGLRSGVPR